VGYAPSAWDKVLLASRSAGFSNRELWEAGLAQRAKGEGKLFDRFRRRIMFPLCDTRGRVLGFGARAMGEGQQPKYVNSSDNAVYHKGKHLFGGDIARAHSSRAGSVILAEGYTDVIAMHQAGLKNTVGLMGTALTEDQVGELGRLAPVVQLALDADSAGKEAMLRAARVAAHRKLDLRVVPLPAGSDPADLVRASGARAMQELVDRSVSFVRFRVERELDRADLGSTEGKDRVIEALRPVFSDIEAGALREDLIALVADRIDISPALVGSWLAEGASASSQRVSVPQGGSGGGNGASASRHRALDASARAERDFLVQVIADPAHGHQALATIDLDATFSVELNRRAAAHLRDHPGHPTSDVEPEDRELGALFAELPVRASDVRPSAAALEAQSLTLDLRRVERDITAARRAEAGDVAPLVARREELRTRLDRAIERTMAETDEGE
jgi:DNA primase